MKTLACAVALLALIGCSKSKAVAPDTSKMTVAQEIKKQTATALSQADFDACSHIKAVVRDPSTEQPYASEKPTGIKRYASDMDTGEEAYIWGLYRDNGGLFVNQYTQLTPQPTFNEWYGGESNIHVRRTKEGFLLDCKSALYIVDNKPGPRYTVVSRNNLIPVVGMIP